ncbi:MAG TPA: hypothetical protein VNA16_03880 [Abditibacteriaceae bacterium]|nr:hypothetical protein [Abditibacteriaceae bacterium]
MTPETSEEYNRRIYAAKREWHRRQAQLPVKEKMRIMLEMQKRVLPLLARQRTLHWWEKPWDIEP